MGYYERYVAKQSKDNNLWKVIIDEPFTEGIIVMDSINDSNVAYQIATQLNCAYQIGSEHERQSIKHKMDNLLFED